MVEIFVETDLELYADFHDVHWMKALSDLAVAKEESVECDRFLVHWRGAASAFSTPWLLVDAVAGLTGSESRDCWDRYLSAVSFRVGLWKHAENCFSALYYAYENLLVSLVVKRSGVATRVGDKAFRKLLSAALGESLAQEAWDARFIRMSREIRNSIVHCGSMASSKLRELNPPGQLVSDSGFLTVSATDVRTLYHGLRPVITKAFS